MRSLRRFLTRPLNPAARRAQDERLREEIEEHIALQTEESLRAGLSPIEARRQSMLKFGGVVPRLGLSGVRRRRQPHGICSALGT
jgi:hypothetical protein